MIYIYDIIVNDSEELVDFYDYMETDTFKHIRKALLFKVSTNAYIDFVYKNTIVSREVLDKVKDKCEYYDKNIIRKIGYAFIISNGENALFLECDKNGLVTMKSKFLVNEEIEILDVVNRSKKTNIKYKVTSNNVYRKYTRSQEETINKIVSYLDRLKSNKEIISYLCDEWFNDETLTYQELVNDLSREYSGRHIEFLNVIEMIALNNNV